MRVLVWLVSGTIGWALALPVAALAQAEAVMLQIRPRAGDTLRVRLDQTVEMTGTVRGSTGPSISESSSLVVLTRLYVENRDGRANAGARRQVIRRLRERFQIIRAVCWIGDERLAEQHLELVRQIR